MFDNLSNEIIWYFKYKSSEVYQKEEVVFVEVVLTLRLMNTSPVSENPSFCVADFAILSDERRLRSKIVLLFNTDKRTLRSKI